jgi:hypothetical protein
MEGLTWNLINSRFVNESADFWQPELNAIAVAVEVRFVLWRPLLFQGLSI